MNSINNARNTTDTVSASHVHNFRPQTNASGQQQSITGTSDARDIKDSGRITDQQCDHCQAYGCSKMQMRYRRTGVKHLQSISASDTARGQELCKLPQRGLGQSPRRNRIWCILAVKYLVATILISLPFLRINLPHFVQFKQYYDKSGNSLNTIASASCYYLNACCVLSD